MVTSSQNDLAGDAMFTGVQIHGVIYIQCQYMEVVISNLGAKHIFKELQASRLTVTAST